MNRILHFLLFATGILLAFGCQSSSHPWSGESYQEPSNGAKPPQSTYAPMPSILPSIDANSLKTEITDPTIPEAENFGEFKDF
jgi:hypothetical protein